MPTVKQEQKKARTEGYQPWFSGLLFPQPKRIGFQCHTEVIKRSNIDRFREEIASADYVSLDTETTSLRWADQETQLVSINIGLPGNRNYVGFVYQGYFTEEQRGLIATQDELKEIVSLVLDKERIFMWNRYFDQHVLQYKMGFQPDRFYKVYDCLILFWALDSNMKSGLSLKRFAEEFLGIENYSLEDSEWENILTMDPRQLIEYGGLDAYATVEAGQLLYGIYKQKYPVMLKLFLENGNALYDFQETVQCLDTEYLSSLVKDLSAGVKGLLKDFYETYGPINLASNPQKSALLFRLGYDTGKRNQPAKDGTPIMKVDRESLDALIKRDGGCPPAKAMIEFAEMNKLLTSYAETMYEVALNAKSVPVRFHIRDHNTATLRYSAGSYNIKRKPYYYLPVSLQCLPKSHKSLRELNFDPHTFKIEWCPSGVRGEYLVETQVDAYNVRKAIVPPPGGWFIKADFSQQEIRIPASLAHETTWIDAINAGTDPHRATMEKAYGRPVNSEERAHGKAANFGLLYEIHNPEFVISNQFGWDLDKATQFFTAYKSALPRLYAWKQKVISESRITGNVRNPVYGFERRVQPYFSSPLPHIRRFAERTVVNQHVQGFAALMMRHLVTKLWRWCMVPGGPYYGKGIYPIATIHDELDIAYTNTYELLPEVLLGFRDLMQSVTPPDWPVKLDVEVEIGYNMGETFVVQYDEGQKLWLPKQEERKDDKPVVAIPAEEVVFADDLDGEDVYGF